MLEDLQQDLFVAQAELAGAEPKITSGDLTKLEDRINKIEKQLPVIKSFFVAGGTELSALLDFARAVSRRVERAAVRLYDDGAMNKDLYSYMNRISSFLYVLARLTNSKSGIKEVRPHY
jgi:cob(I)alamin adenosyltransferase